MVPESGLFGEVPHTPMEEDLRYHCVFRTEENGFTIVTFIITADTLMLLSVHFLFRELLVYLSGLPHRLNEMIATV